MAVKGSKPAAGIIVPHLIVRDAANAVDFYQSAFDAQVLFRSPTPSGAGEHVHLKIWASLVQVSSEEPAQTSSGSLSLSSPETLGGSTSVFQVGVSDVDAAYERAVRHGAVSRLPPTDMFWGDRYALVCDPFGQTWAFSTVHELLTPEQVAERMHGEFDAETPIPE